MNKAIEIPACFLDRVSPAHQELDHPTELNIHVGDTTIKTMREKGDNFYLDDELMESAFYRASIALGISDPVELENFLRHALCGVRNERLYALADVLDEKPESRDLGLAVDVVFVSTNRETSGPCEFVEIDIPEHPYQQF